MLATASGAPSDALRGPTAKKALSPLRGLAALPGVGFQPMPGVGINSLMILSRYCCFE